jgi:hypothetical protein
MHRHLQNGEIMTSHEKKLLRLLALVCILSLGLLAAMGAKNAVDGLEADLARARKQLAAFEQSIAEGAMPSADSLEAMAAEKKELEKRFYPKGQVSVYTQAESLRLELADCRLSVDQLAIDTKRREISVQARGPVSGALELVRRIQSGEHFIAIKLLQIQGGQEGSGRMNIRVEYVENPL